MSQPIIGGSCCFIRRVSPQGRPTTTISSLPPGNFLRPRFFSSTPTHAVRENDLLSSSIIF